MRLLCACQWRIQEFPLGGAELLGRRQPLTRALFSKNVCKKERIGSHRGRGAMCWWCPPWICQCMSLADPGGHRQCVPPQQDPILSFSHMFSPKSTHVRGRHPPMARCPPPKGNPGSATAC